jgi:hypothetical protein
MDEDDEDEPNGKLEKGLFFRTIGRDAKSVKHFTGFKWDPYLWVKNALIDAVRECVFFFVFVACPRALSLGSGGSFQVLKSNSHP